MKLVFHSATLFLLALATFRCQAQTAAPQPISPQRATEAPAPLVHKVPKFKPLSTTQVAAPVGSSTAITKPAPPKPRPTTSPASTANASSSSRQLPASPFNRTVVLLDPAHGGLDAGARISDSILEKDVTLSLAFRLRSLLTARGFTVIMTRDSNAAAESNNPGTPLTLDDRAGIANHAHAVACLLLHATAAGSGVHLYSSELDPTPGEATVTPWLTAQAAWVSQSQRLQQQLANALTRASLSLVSSRASVRPLDSLTCPALIVELAPNGSDDTTLNDAGYQQRVAQTIAGALVFWQNQAQPPPRIAPTPPETSTPTTAGAQP